MIHIYHGDGKGKTTAACGLALRMAGRGGRVLFTQFFKDGSSGEIAPLSSLPLIEVRRPDCPSGRFRNLSPTEREEVCRGHREFLSQISRRAGEYELIVLDEAISAYNYGTLDRDGFMELLAAWGGSREIVLTGRSPAPELLEAADYITEMRKIKHPFDSGTPARRGVEF